MISEGVLHIFFSFISSEYGPGKLLSHQDVWLYRKKNQLRIRVQGCYKAFLSYIRRENMGLENTSKADLVARLKDHPAFLECTKGIQVGFKQNQGGYVLKDMVSGQPVPARPGSMIVVLEYGKIEDFSLPEIQWDEMEEIEAEIVL